MVKKIKSFSNLLIVLSASIATFNISAKEDKSNFFATLKSLCGSTFVGKTVYPEDPDHDFAGKKLVANVAECSDTQIKVPFKVGEDTSRTWIFSLTDKGLLFKHDHRHKDGTPDEITMYGGYAVKTESANKNEVKVSFPADEYTAKLIPAAKTNVWTVTINPEKGTFVYYLERHAKPRYKAELLLEK